MAVLAVRGIACLDDAVACADVGVGAFVVEANDAAQALEARALVNALAGRGVVVLATPARGELALRRLVEATGAGCVQFDEDVPEAVLRPFLPHAYRSIEVASVRDAERAGGANDYVRVVITPAVMARDAEGARARSSLVALARARRATLAGDFDVATARALVDEVAPFCVEVRAEALARPDASHRIDIDRVRGLVRAVQ